MSGLSSETVVLLHGQPGSAADWDLVCEDLHGVRVLARNRPGYDGRPAGGFDRNAVALLELMDAAGIDRAVLAGYSWGAGVALRAALDAPERVSALALIAPVGSVTAFGFRDRLVGSGPSTGLMPAVLRRFGPVLTPLVAAATGSRLQAAARHRLRRQVSAAAAESVWRTYRVEQVALSAESAELESRLSEISAPAEVLIGHRDRSVRPAAARRLAELLPAADLHEIDAGHLLLLEAPAAVAATIRQAVRRSAPG